MNRIWALMHWAVESNIIITIVINKLNFLKWNIQLSACMWTYIIIKANSVQCNTNKNFIF